MPVAEPGPDRATDGPARDRTDEVTFRVTSRRVFAMMAVTAVVSWLVINAFTGLLPVLLGRTSGLPEPAPLLASAVVYASVFAGIFTFAVRRHPAWVTVSPGGLELAATGRDPVFLPWSSVQTVDRRFPGPFAELVVTPTAIDAVRITRRGWSRPRTVVRGGHLSYVVDTGLMRPGPDALLAEIHRRLSATP